MRRAIGWSYRLPKRGGWYWVRWFPDETEEPVHVVVEQPGSGTVLYAYEEDEEHFPLTAEGCAFHKVEWLPYTDKNDTAVSRT